jgi:hypothetical protein
MRKFKDWLFLSTYLFADSVGLHKLAVKAWSAYLANGPVYDPNVPDYRSLPDDVQ